MSTNKSPDRRIFKLLSLPPELRSIIYQIVFTASERILTRHSTRSSETDGSETDGSDVDGSEIAVNDRQLEGRVIHHRGEQWQDPIFEPYVLQHKGQVLLLCTCKVVYHEAKDIL